MKKNTTYILAGIGAVALFIIGYFVWIRVYVPTEGSVASLNGIQRPVPQTPTAPEEIIPAETPAGAAVRPPTSASTDYEKALNDYRSRGAYFQFVNCAGNPGSLTLKRGTVFMLDNRDSKAHKIKVGTVTYTVGGYGYKLVNPQTLGLNHITCDGGGAAAVNVQR